MKYKFFLFFLGFLFYSGCALNAAKVDSVENGGTPPTNPDATDPDVTDPDIVVLKVSAKSDVESITLHIIQGEASSIQYSTDADCTWAAPSHCSDYGSLTGDFNQGDIVLTPQNHGLELDKVYFFALKDSSTHENHIVNARIYGMHPNGFIYSILHTDLRTYLGGDFHDFRAFMGGGVTVSASTGDLVGGLPPVLGTVHTVVSDGLGGWFLGGKFTRIGDVSRTNLAHVDAFGSVTNWQPETNGVVKTMAISNGIVYLGGNFTTLHSFNRKNLAAVQANDGTLLTNWKPEANGEVNTLAVSNGIVYVGGNFTQIGTSSFLNLAALQTTDGTPLTDWKPQPNGAVNALVISGDVVYVGGNFTTLAGVSRNYIGALDLKNTNSLKSWNPSANGAINAISIADGIIYVGGAFTTLGGQTRSHLGSIEAHDGSVLDWNPQANGVVKTIAVAHETVYAGGDFTKLGTTTRNYLGAIQAKDASVLANWNPNADSSVYTMVIQNDIVYIGGNLTRFGEKSLQARSYLAALDADGVLQNWIFNTDKIVYSIKIDKLKNILYVGGDFLNVNAIARRGIFGLDLTKNEITIWDAKLTSSVRVIDINDNLIFIGGNFSGDCLKVFDENGNILQNFQSPKCSGVITDLKSSADIIYMVGGFSDTSVDVLAVEKLTGTKKWSQTTYPDVWALALSENGDTLYIGGTFASVGAVPNDFKRDKVAALNALNGSVREDFNVPVKSPDPTLYYPVTTLEISGNTLFLGGFFNSVGGLPRNNIGAIDVSQNEVIENWFPEISSESLIWDIAVAKNADGTKKVFFGGEFQELKNTQYKNFGAVPYIP